MTVLISALLGVLAASMLGLTAEQVLNRAYDAGNTALRVNIVSGGGITSGTTTISGGADTQVLFNDDGVVNGDNDLVWNKTTNILSGPAAIRTGDGSAAAPAHSFSGETGTGWYRAGANDLRLSQLGVDRIRYLGGPIIIPSTGNLQFSSSGAGTGVNNPILQYDGAPGTLAQRNGTAAQTWRTYGQYVDASNYDRVSISKVAGGTATISTEALGSGVAGSLAVVLGGTTAFTISTSGHTQAGANNARDLGTSGARFRNGVFGTEVGLHNGTSFTSSFTATGMQTTGDITSSDTGDLGWSVQAAANQACSTTCTSACAAGFDLVAGFLNCASALADQCLCAGAS